MILDTAVKLSRFVWFLMWLPSFLIDYKRAIPQNTLAKQRNVILVEQAQTTNDVVFVSYYQCQWIVTIVVLNVTNINSYKIKTII